MSIHLFIQHTYNEVTIIKFSDFRNELSIIGSRTLGCSVIRFCQVEEVLRRDLG